MVGLYRPYTIDAEQFIVILSDHISEKSPEECILIGDININKEKEEG